MAGVVYDWAKVSPNRSVGEAYKEGSLLTYTGRSKTAAAHPARHGGRQCLLPPFAQADRALFRSGKDFEILPLSGLTHMVPDPQVMENLHGRIARFLRKNLQ